jgi:hypothetical protein
MQNPQTRDGRLFMTIPNSKKIYPGIGDSEIVYLKNVIDSP